MVKACLPALVEPMKPSPGVWAARPNTYGREPKARIRNEAILTQRNSLARVDIDQDRTPGLDAQAVIV
jgi:hypothetical protein